MPFQPIYVYVGAAYAESGRGRPGVTRANLFRGQRRDAWQDYQASLRESNIPDDSYWRVNLETFNAIWNMCVSAWGSTNREMRRHAFDARPRMSWVVRSSRKTYRRQFAYHCILVVQGRIDRDLDDAHQAHVISESDTLRRTVNMAVSQVAREALEGTATQEAWVRPGSDLWIYCGNVTGIYQTA